MLVESDERQLVDEIEGVPMVDFFHYVVETEKTGTRLYGVLGVRCILGNSRALLCGLQSRLCAGDTNTNIQLLERVSDMYKGYKKLFHNANFLFLNHQIRIYGQPF